MPEDLPRRNEPTLPKPKEIEQLIQFLRQRDHELFTEQLKTIYPIDFADAWDEAEPADRLLLFRAFPKDYAAEFFSFLDHDEQVRLIDQMSNPEIASVFDSLYVDDMADFLGELPANVVRRIMQVTPAERRRQVNKLLEYPENSAGALMNAETIELKSDQTVLEALESLRSLYRKTRIEEAYSCFILNPARILVGVASVRDIMKADDHEKIIDLMREEVISVRTDDDAMEAARLMQRYDLIALPVVDRERRLVGAVSIDDALDHMTEDALETISGMAGVTRLEAEYLKTPFFAAFRRRIPRLVLRSVLGFAAAAILSRNAELIRRVPYIAFFLPLILHLSGAAAAQSASLIRRAYAQEERSPDESIGLMAREALIGLGTGTLFGLIAALPAEWLFKLPPPATAALGLSVGFSILFAKMIGSLFPYLEWKRGRDHPLSNVPFPQYLSELLSLLLYFFFLSVIL